MVWLFWSFGGSLTAIFDNVRWYLNVRFWVVSWHKSTIKDVRIPLTYMCGSDSDNYLTTIRILPIPRGPWIFLELKNSTRPARVFCNSRWISTLKVCYENVYFYFIANLQGIKIYATGYHSLILGTELQNRCANLSQFRNYFILNWALPGMEPRVSCRVRANYSREVAKFPNFVGK